MSRRYVIPGRVRWTCPVCGNPVGRQGTGLAKHGQVRCLGTGAEIAVLDEHVEPDQPPPPPRPEPELPEPWIPAPVPVDLAPFRRWRALGWTEHQIAAVTGEGALW